MEKSGRITRASKSLEFHPGKKEIGESGWRYSPSEWLRLDSYYSSFSKWTTTSRTYPARHARNFGRGPVCGFQSCRSREQCGRGIDERTLAPPPCIREFAISRKKNEGRNRTPRSEFAASSCPTRILPTSFVEWNDRFEFPSWEGKVKRWLSRRNFMFFVR